MKEAADTKKQLNARVLNVLVNDVDGAAGLTRIPRQQIVEDALIQYFQKNLTEEDAKILSERQTLVLRALKAVDAYSEAGAGNKKAKPMALWGSRVRIP